MKHIEKTLPFSVHNSVRILKLFLLTGCNFNAFYVLLNEGNYNLWAHLVCRESSFLITNVVPKKGKKNHP